jgi:hypothetical protein
VERRERQKISAKCQRYTANVLDAENCIGKIQTGAAPRSREKTRTKRSPSEPETAGRLTRNTGAVFVVCTPVPDSKAHTDGGKNYDNNSETIATENGQERGI